MHCPLSHRYKTRLILFGGTCGSFFYNHLFEYDTIEQVWTRLQAQGRPPNPRYKHQAVRAVLSGP